MTLIAVWLNNFTPLQSRPTRNYLAGQATSLMGVWLQQTTLALLVFQLSGEQALALGINALCASAPVLLFSLFTGALADRYDRRRLLIGCHVMEVLLTVCLATMVHTESVTLIHVYLFSFLLGCVGSVHFPTQQAFLYDLAGTENIRKLVSINSMILNVCRTLGPTLAGFLVAHQGMSTAFWFNAASYGVVILSLLSLHTVAQERPEQQRSPELGEALRYIRGHLPLRNVYLCCTTLTVFGLGTLTLMPAVADGDPQRTGLLLAAAAGGSLIYAVFLSPVISYIQHMGLVISLTLVWMGAWLLVAALAPWLELRMLSLFMFGLATSQAMVACTGMVQWLAPAGMRGRLMGLFSILGFGLQPLATVAGGYIADRVGVTTTLALWALFAMTIASALLLQPGWRKWDLSVR